MVLNPFADFNFLGFVHTLGNSVKIWVKYNDSRITSDVYKLIFEGIQKTGCEEGLDYASPNIEFSTEFYSIDRVVLESVPTSKLYYYYALTDDTKFITTKDVYDWLYYEDPTELHGNRFYSNITLTTTGIELSGLFWIVSHTNFLAQINYLCNYVYYTYTRTAGLTFAIELPLPTYYKQNYLNDGTLGTAITSPDDIYYTAFVADRVHTDRLNTGLTLYGGMFYRY
jgi:hypothetical protein